IEPEVSDPRAKGTTPAATALAGPLEDPPDQCEVSQGFRPGPKSEADVVRYPPPPASSTMESFPMRMAPVLSSFCNTVAVSSKTWVAYGFAPQVVGWPAS